MKRLIIDLENFDEFSDRCQVNILTSFSGPPEIIIRTADNPGEQIRTVFNPADPGFDSLPPFIAIED